MILRRKIVSLTLLLLFVANGGGIASAAEQNQ
jgi:hypothetical protein